MKKSTPGFLECYRGFRNYGKLPLEKKRIVFYSESKAYWPFLAPFVKTLLETTDEHLVYVSSETDDPGLTSHPERVSGFVIGSGMIRSFWFSMLKANVLVMTMPDLDIYHVKRSQTHPVHYVYVMHGCDSVSMVLREQALDRFDSIFCAGPHNIEEIHKREQMKNLPAKNLVEVGYPYQDELIAAATNEPQFGEKPGTDRPIRVLLAPSWSDKNVGTLETVGHELVGILLDAGFETTLRPHPQSRKFHPKVIESIRKTYGHRPGFVLEADTTGKESLMKADILISDWSAITFEFAFSRLKPVLYIDVPKKAMNPNYEELGIVPFEVRIREKIGAVLAPSNIRRVPEEIRRLCSSENSYQEHLRSILTENVYNVGSSAVIGAAELVKLADQRELL